MPLATNILNPSIRETFLMILLDRLFISQREFWRNKLQNFSNTNRIMHGRFSDHAYGIHYLNRNWEGNSENLWTEDPIFLTIHPKLLDREKEILEIVGQLAVLETEEYEVNRFLSGLVLFPAPFRVLEKILGKELSTEIRSEFRIKGSLNLQEVYEDSSPWDENADKAIMTYVNQHKYILTIMNQRLVTNMITQDQIR